MTRRLTQKVPGRYHITDENMKLRLELKALKAAGGGVRAALKMKAAAAKRREAWGQGHAKVMPNQPHVSRVLPTSVVPGV